MKDPILLTRDEFRNKIFERDVHCVFCDKPYKDAHHIIERRLWPDGGYYMENGIAVCEEHHRACESTDISVEDARYAGKITRIVLPPHLYEDQSYDKWGDPILPNGQRLRGELFYDESVQKNLSSKLSLFTHWVKYPRTYHLPWSENLTEDDRMLEDVSLFEGRDIVVTTKMDGENSTLYSDYIHARSVDSKNHLSRNWLKNFWSNIQGDIPEKWRVCGENLFAEHSIHYTDLPSYFMGFSVWDDKNICLSWDETKDWFKLLNIISVPELYRGVFDAKKIQQLWSSNMSIDTEGYVVRLADSFSYSKFNSSMAKFVRKNHVQTVKHWMHGKPIVPNDLKKI